MLDSDLLVIFLHIPKAAGSTLESILFRLYRKTNIFRLSSRRELSIDDVASLKEMSNGEKASIKALTGIMDFGLHSIFPQKAKYITILRDPVERILSHYHFVKHTSSHHHHKELNASKISLLEYLDWGPKNEMDNGQTRQISGMDFGFANDIFRDCQRKDFELAKQNIDKYFAVTGTLKHFDESLLLIKRVIGWPFPFYQRINVGKRKREETAPEVIRAIQERNRWDLLLYQYASSRLEQKIREQGPGFQLELAAFRASGYFARKYPRVYWYAKEAIQRVRKVVSK